MRAPLLLLPLALVACHRAEVWITPDAKVEIESADGAKATNSVSAGKPTTIGFPTGNHHIRIEAKGRATVVARVEYTDGKCDYAPTSTRICAGSKRKERHRHPLEWLRGDGAPFRLPPPGQGIVVTADISRGSVDVSSRAGKSVARRSLEASRTGRRALPLVLPLPPGDYRLTVGDRTHVPSSENVLVRPGEYIWRHAMIGEQKPPYGGSGWLH